MWKISPCISIKSINWNIVALSLLFVLQMPETSQTTSLSTMVDNLRKSRYQWGYRQWKFSYSRKFSNTFLSLKGGADEDSEQNLIGDLVLDDIEGRTLEQEIEALERELEDAQDSRAVAEQANSKHDALSPVRLNSFSFR
jgi:hypothetical protein